MRRFLPGIILAAIITGLIVYLLGPGTRAGARDQIRRRGDQLKEQAQAWWERSREQASRAVEGMGR